MESAAIFIYKLTTSSVRLWRSFLSYSITGILTYDFYYLLLLGFQYARGDWEHRQDFDGNTPIQEFLNKFTIQPTVLTEPVNRKGSTGAALLEVKDPTKEGRGSRWQWQSENQQWRRYLRPSRQPMEEEPGTLLGQYPRSQISSAPGSSLLQASYRSQSQVPPG